MPVLHYGPVPRFRPQTWDLHIFGATAKGDECRLSWAEFSSLPHTSVRADLHCVTRFSVLDNLWTGVTTATLVDVAPPAPEVTHVMVFAEYGYCSNLALSDFLAERSIFATHRNGACLSPEHGYPVRLVVPHLYAWKGPKWVRALEYLTEDRRGFWEERGYHNVADPWREQRYAYQELPGEGPPHPAAGTDASMHRPRAARPSVSGAVGAGGQVAQSL